jgi:hypothetical protein
MIDVPSCPLWPKTAIDIGWLDEKGTEGFLMKKGGAVKLQRKIS